MSGKENIVLIIMDSVRHSGSKFSTRHSNNYFTTDFINNSTTFESAYTSAPWTLPSHASLFTGTSPSKHGAHAGHKHLNDTLMMLPEILQNHGYETAAVSNNTWISGEFGFDRGFDTFYKTWQYVQSDTDLGKIAQMQEGLDMLREAAKEVFTGNPVTNVANAIYGQFFRRANDDGAARTNEWVKDWLTTKSNSQPFFLFVNYLEPHLEYRPPKAYAKEFLPEHTTYEQAMEVPQDAWGYIVDTVEMTDQDFQILRAFYRAEIAYLEQQIKDVINHLKAEDEWEDTLFILTSDHGENIGDHGLMDHQYALYDTLLHVPLYVHGGPFEDDQLDDLVQILDLPPTILDILDIDAPKARRQFQGISFHPNVDESREYAISEYMAPQPSIDALERKVAELPEQAYEYDRSLKAIRTDKYKYIRGSDDTQELYNIQDDSTEQSNLVETRPDVVKRLDGTLDEWLDSFEQTEQSEDVSMADDTMSRLENLGYLQ